MKLMPERYTRPHHHERVQSVERKKRTWADETTREAAQRYQKQKIQ